MLAARGQLAHVPEPRAKSLETGLGTYADKTQLLWTLLALQADKGATEALLLRMEARMSSRANSWSGGKSAENTASLHPTTSEMYMLMFCLSCTMLSH